MSITTSKFPIFSVDQKAPAMDRGKLHFTFLPFYILTDIACPGARFTTHLKLRIFVCSIKLVWVKAI